MPAPDKMLEMGVFGRAHGIRGEISLVWHGESQPARGQTIYALDAAGLVKPYRIESLRLHKGRPVVALQGINSRTDAEALNGLKIYLDRGDLTPLESGEAYLADLEECEIFLPDGKLAGTLDHVEFPAGQQIWVINGPDGNEILFPAQSCFIDWLDVDNKKIGINPPPGLLDIYNA